MIRRLFQATLVLLLLLVVALTSAIATMHFAIHGAEVRTPDLQGLSEAEARRKAAGASLEISVGDRFYSTVVPAQRVVTQTPAAGTLVRSGWQVRVGMSLGPQRVAIPTVLHDGERDATLTLRRSGLQVGTIARMPYAPERPGTVIAQSPDAGSVAVDRPEVSLLFSTQVPVESGGFVMPEFTNQPVQGAVQAATKAGFKLAAPLTQPTAIPENAGMATPGAAPGTPAAPVAPGTVLAQHPAAGSRIEAGATIQFTVAQ